jgi:hypothetical protein
MMKDFKISFALKDSEYMTAVRLVAGAVCALGDVDVDCSEDFKVCVTESCIMLKNCGYDDAEVDFCLTDGVTAKVCGFGGKPKTADNELSLALISALVSSCEIEKADGAINRVLLKI